MDGNHAHNSAPGNFWDAFSNFDRATENNGPGAGVDHHPRRPPPPHFHPFFGGSDFPFSGFFGGGPRGPPRHPFAGGAMEGEDLPFRPRGGPSRRGGGRHESRGAGHHHHHPHHPHHPHGEGHHRRQGRRGGRHQDGEDEDAPSDVEVLFAHDADVNMGEDNAAVGAGTNAATGHETDENINEKEKSPETLRAGANTPTGDDDEVPDPPEEIPSATAGAGAGADAENAARECPRHARGRGCGRGRGRHHGHGPEGPFRGHHGPPFGFWGRRGGWGFDGREPFDGAYNFGFPFDRPHHGPHHRGPHPPPPPHPHHHRGGDDFFGSDAPHPPPPPHGQGGANFNGFMHDMSAHPFFAHLRTRLGQRFHGHPWAAGHPWARRHGRGGPWAWGFGGFDSEEEQPAANNNNNNGNDNSEGLFASNNDVEADQGQTFTPPVDVFSTPDADGWIVHVAIPGAKKSDVGVHWDPEDRSLTVSGVVHRPGDEALLAGLVSGERRVGYFERSIPLPSAVARAAAAAAKKASVHDDNDIDIIDVDAEKDDAGHEVSLEVDADGITARMEEGVLIIVVPTVEREWTQVRKVDIE